MGIEAEIEVPLTNWLTIAASGSYAHHTYRFTNTVAANSTESIFSGDDVDTAPRTLGNLRFVWTPHENVRGEVEWVHVGEYFTDASNAHRYPGHDLVNLRISWQSESGLGRVCGAAKCNGNGLCRTRGF